ncbi:hypothetical protein ACLKA6_003647 [Drosophila palustris]
MAITRNGGAQTSTHGHLRIFNTRVILPSTGYKQSSSKSSGLARFQNPGDPKAGKASQITPKDFRPISLTSFLLKTFERILSLHLRASIPSGLISNSQHAYRKRRSTETAHCHY